MLIYEYCIMLTMDLKYWITTKSFMHSNLPYWKVQSHLHACIHILPLKRWLSFILIFFLEILIMTLNFLGDKHFLEASYIILYLDYLSQEKGFLKKVIVTSWSHFIQTKWILETFAQCEALGRPLPLIFTPIVLFGENNFPCFPYFYLRNYLKFSPLKNFTLGVSF